MKRVYVSGPMTGIPQHNFPAFNSASALLRDKGYQVVNPAEINPHPGKDSWERCRRNDIRALCECDAIALLPGWESSKGAHLEVHLGHRLGMSISTIQEYT